ncbi:MAG: hypothetical protein EB100_00695 [Crocinitomicaceae bacterium]|jgi:uncharacterized protein (TIGR02145 family)|nr:hypothetical protein [Crocinitomicaceae bacterium]
MMKLGKLLIYASILWSFGLLAQEKPILFNLKSEYGVVKDEEGHEYMTIQIGNQTWMAENLRATKYRNGDDIALSSKELKDITKEESPKYQWSYGGDEKNIESYGRLYTWFIVDDSRGICPTGWHIPTDSEWSELINVVDGDSKAAVKLRESGTQHWMKSKVETTNESGFTALPGGFRDAKGSFFVKGFNGYWWSTKGYVKMEFNKTTFSLSALVGTQEKIKRNGLSVRCLKD